MIFSAAGLTLYFNKSTFGVERMAAAEDPEALSFVSGKTFGLPCGNNFLLKSEYSDNSFIGEFLYFNEIVCTLVVSEKEGTISFRYTFRNEGKEAVDLSEGDLGICLPFFDRCDDAELSLRRRVHAHLCTRGNFSAYCERYSGAATSLGVVMTEGTIYSYALESGERAGERGEILLRLPAMKLAPQESYSVELCYYLCNTREDFYKKADRLGFLNVKASALTVYEGEEIVLSSKSAEKVRTEKGEVSFRNGEARIDAIGPGEHSFEIVSGDQVALGAYYVLPKDIFERRAGFILERQFLSDGRYAGAFTAYDRLNDEMLLGGGVRSPFRFGGESAAALLFLLREGAAGRLSELARESLDRAIAFYDREIYRGGEVADDAGGKRARFCKNYDHYPLFAAIKYEEYRYKGDIDALLESASILSEYFERERVYAVTPFLMVTEALGKEGQDAASKALIDRFSRGAAWLLLDDKKAFREIKYSASFVCGAVVALVDLFAATGRKEYLEGAKRYLAMLDAFTFPSLSYATDCVPTLYECDLGKGAVYDMSPRYTAIDFAVAYERAFRVTGEERYHLLSVKIARACLTLFGDRGASCRAKAAASILNGRELSPFEEISCGEDIVLYYIDLLFERK